MTSAAIQATIRILDIYQEYLLMDLANANGLLKHLVIVMTTADVESDDLNCF